MLRWLAKVPRPRFRVATLLAMVAAVAVGLGSWIEYRRPARVWWRTIHSKDPVVAAGAWLQINLKGRIDGLDAAESAAEVVRAAEDRDPSIRLIAISHGFWVDKRSIWMVPAYLRCLGDPDPKLRAGAAKALGVAVRWGVVSDRAQPALLAATKDTDASVREAIFGALGDLAKRHEKERDDLIRILTSKLRDPDDSAFLAAAGELIALGRGEAAIPRLEAFMIADRARNGARVGHQPGSADDSLAKLAERSDAVVAFLLREVYRRGQGMPNRFLYALPSGPGPAQDRAKAIATAALAGNDRDLRVGAAYYLGSVRSDPAVRAVWLDAIRHHDDPDVRRDAINTLWDYYWNQTRDPTIVDLFQAVRRDDPDPAVRRAAADALRRGPMIADPGQPP